MRREGMRGFSLLEIMFVVVVLGLVMAIGLPGVLTQLGKLRLESTAGDIANLFRQTRLRAIRDNEVYRVGVDTGKIVGRGLIDADEVELDFSDPRILIYNAGDGPADCLDKYDGGPTPFDDEIVDYAGTGIASGTVAVCVHDNKGNVLQIVLEYPTGQPKIRKYMAAAASPSGSQGFFEKTGFNTTTDTGNVWVWY